MSDSGFSKGHGRNHVRVLIVDDDPLMCALLEKYLSRGQDFKVVGIASNGAEGVELCGRLQPHVVVMDNMMPVMDGLTATRLIRAQHPEIQIVMLTASPDAVLEAQAFEVGVFACLPKISFRNGLLDSVSAAAGAAGH
jgi:CheY-like chemotaxis protein